MWRSDVTAGGGSWQPGADGPCLDNPNSPKTGRVEPPKQELTDVV